MLREKDVKHGMKQTGTAGTAEKNGKSIMVGMMEQAGQINRIEQIDRIGQIEKAERPEGMQKDGMLTKEELALAEETSPLREGLLNWYEFRKTGSLVELNPGSGALTGLFLSRVRSVTVVCGSTEQKEYLTRRFGECPGFCAVSREQADKEAAYEGAFDYAVLYGMETFPGEPAEILRAAGRFLRSDGILLAEAGGRFGLKYFCGAKDPASGLPYGGLNLRKGGPRAPGQLYTRRELEEAAESAGFPVRRLFFPVPDARFPQMIFTDGYRNAANADERLADYDYGGEPMVGLEHRIFGRAIESGALSFLSNSFLLELRREGKSSDIVYALTTTDRGPAHGMATTVREGGLVKKRPLLPEGLPQLAALHRNTVMLRRAGIPAAETMLREDEAGPVLEMPYIEGESLSRSLERLILDDRQQFLGIFDEIAGYIRTAFAADPAHPVVYLDLAPCNCFLTKEGLVFYDQEFAVSDMPPEFGIFRTLKYWYASFPSAEEILPLRSMYLRYGIGPEDEAVFEQREQAFLAEVRPLSEHRAVMEAAVPDLAAVRRRQELLAGTAEKTAAGPAENCSKPYHIGYVPGVFDLLHTGHVKLLTRCKERCDYLIVGVLTDELVQFYKGAPPVLPYRERAEMVAALSVTDRVVPVDHSNTDKLDAWKQLHYDCHFSGDDHAGHWKEVQAELKKRGVEMEFFPYTKGISTTWIKERIRKGAGI